MFDDLSVAIEVVQETDLDGVPSDVLNEMVVTLQRQKAQLAAAEARVLARWDGDSCWAADGARSGAAWLGARCRLPNNVTGQRIRQARVVAMLPSVAAAWKAGEIDRTHLATMLGARNPRTEKAFEEGHKELLDAARTLSFHQFQGACRMWSDQADPDGAERSAAEDRDARELHLSQSGWRMWFGRITLDPVSGEIVHTTLSMIERELFQADWAEARERLCREPMLFELRRTPAQRRADALVEMATRARTAPADGRRPAPLFEVLVGYETFAGPIREMWNGTVLTPGTLAGWLDEADIERIVFDGPSKFIDVGPRRRFFRGAMRQAIRVRDRTCFHWTCEKPPDRSQIDHIVEASKGGLTTQANGRLACGFHNRLRNTRPDLCDDPDPPPW